MKEGKTKLRVVLDTNVYLSIFLFPEKKRSRYGGLQKRGSIRR